MARRLYPRAGDLLLHASADTAPGPRVVARTEWHDADLGRARRNARLQVDLGALMARWRASSSHRALISGTRILFLCSIALLVHIAAGP